MDEPQIGFYRAEDREELFAFVRATFAEDARARFFAQWDWKYQSNPFNPPQGPPIYLIRIGAKLISILATIRMPIWTGAGLIAGEHRGEWMVDPTYRRQRVWHRGGDLYNPQLDIPIQFGWASKDSTRAAARLGWLPGPMSRLLRILDPAPKIARITGSAALASIGSRAAAIAHASARARAASWLRRMIRNRPDGRMTRIEAFDDRADALWERARRPDRAMILRDRRYLEWRFCQRPDASYTIFGFERAGELAGYLVARAGMRDGEKVGYVVDFLVAPNESKILSALIDAAVDDFRAAGVASVCCYATDAAARRALMLRGFFPARESKPPYFNRLVHRERTDLQRFADLSQWYLTMGDGDLEMSM